MATSPYGGFADLSSYRTAVDAAKRANADPLSSLIQGFQQGQAIKNLPQAMAEEALNKQIALEIQLAKLDALKRSVPTELESAIQQATQQGLARQLGVVQANQSLGAAALPALPVSVEAQRAILATPDDAPLINETISPLNIPTQVAPGAVFDPQTATAMQQQAVRAKQLQAQELLRGEQEIRNEYIMKQIEARAKARGFKTYVNPNNPSDTTTLDATERPPAGWIEVVKGKGGSGGDGKPATEAQAKDTFLASTMITANETFDNLEKAGYDPTRINAENLAPGYFPKILRSDEKKRYDVAAEGFGQAVLRKETGAAFSKEEKQFVSDRFVPIAGDPPEVVADKKLNRAIAADVIAKTATGPRLSMQQLDQLISEAKSKIINEGKTTTSQTGAGTRSAVFQELDKEIFGE